MRLMGLLTRISLVHFHSRLHLPEMCSCLKLNIIILKPHHRDEIDKFHQI